MRLHELRDRKGAFQERKRRGRGPGSGLGKTAGRGMNGQKSRSGTALGSFEGGQMPIYQRMPKRGFNNINRRRMAIVNLHQLQTALDQGRLDASETIDEDKLVNSGLVRRKRDGIRLLANGEIAHSVQLQISGASASAVRAVRKAGGDVLVRTDDGFEPAG